MALALSPHAFEDTGVTRWVLIVESRLGRRHRLWRALEREGFGVVTVGTVEEAHGCLAVIRPALIVADLPGAGDLLDRARAVGIEAASYRDIVGEELP